MKAFITYVTIIITLLFSNTIDAQKTGKQIREEVQAKSLQVKPLPLQVKQQKWFDQSHKNIRLNDNKPGKSPRLPQEVMRYTLDSMVYSEPGEQWRLNYKDEYRYDSTGRYYQNIGWDRDSATGTWVVSDRYTLQFNENGDLLSEIGESHNDNTGTLYVSWKELFTYDSDGNTLSFESYGSQWDQEKNSFVLYGNEKSEWAYDAQGNEILTITYYWDEETEEWIPESKFEYRYENEMELMFGGYMWDQEKKIWIGHFKFEHVWIKEIEQMNSVYYHWDYETDKWYIQGKSEYSFSFDTSGIVVTNINFEWDGETSTLYPSFKTISSLPVKPPYGEQNNFRLNEEYNWNRVTSEWYLIRKVENSFDSKLISTETIVSNWVKNDDTSEYEWRVETIKTNTIIGEKITETLYNTYSYDWVTKTNLITRQSKTTNTYNTEGRLAEELNQFRESEDGIWTMNSRITYTYTSDGRVSSETRDESYSTETSSWTPTRRTDYFYNPDESEAGRTGYEWASESGEWKMTYKEEYYIDEQGRDILTSRIFWNSQLNRYITEDHDETHYDSNGNITMNLHIHTQMIWTGEGYTIETYGNKQEYVFNNDNRMTQEIKYEYMEEKFIEDEKYVYTYDTNYPSTLIKEENFEYNPTTMSWIPSFKGEVTHNFSIPKSVLLLPFGDDDDITNYYFSFMPVEYFTFEWDTINTKWAPESKASLHYTQRQYTSLAEITGTETAIYPNPADRELFVRLDQGQSATLEIFDLQGRKTAIYQVLKGQPVDISLLQKGMYFYRIVSELGSKSGKLLKQ